MRISPRCLASSSASAFPLHVVPPQHSPRNAKCARSAGRQNSDISEFFLACSPRNAEYARSLGADEVVDYRAGPAALEAAVAKAGQFDVVLDVIGGESLKYGGKNWKAVRLVRLVGLA